MVRIRIIWITVMKMPREKMPMRMAFFRRGSFAWTSIGNGVLILQGRSSLVRVLIQFRHLEQSENIHDNIKHYCERCHARVERYCNNALAISDGRIPLLCYLRPSDTSAAADSRNLFNVFKIVELTGWQRLIWTSRKHKWKHVQATAIMIITMRYVLSTAILKNIKSRLSLKPKMLMM